MQGYGENKLSSFLQGIVAPAWFSDTMLNTIGHRETEQALQLGKLYNPTEALAAGLVDQIVEADQMSVTVNETMKRWLKIPGMFDYVSPG